MTALFLFFSLCVKVTNVRIARSMQRKNKELFSLLNGQLALTLFLNSLLYFFSSFPLLLTVLSDLIVTSVYFFFFTFAVIDVVFLSLLAIVRFFFLSSAVSLSHNLLCKKCFCGFSRFTVSFCTPLGCSCCQYVTTSPYLSLQFNVFFFNPRLNCHIDSNFCVQYLQFF